MKNKKEKLVKLAVIRDNNEAPCPFGLSIPFGCKSAGSLITKMAPLDALGNDSNNYEKAKIAKANNKLLTWSIMQGTTEPQRCKFAGKLFPDKLKSVECNYGESGQGIQERGMLRGSPFYSTVFTGVGLEGLNSYPIGWYADFGTTRNSFYGIYSLQGSERKKEIRRLAEEYLKNNPSNNNE